MGVQRIGWRNEEYMEVQRVMGMSEVVRLKKKKRPTDPVDTTQWAPLALH